MSKETQTKRKIIFTREIYKKVSWDIPIIEGNGGITMTGQDLTEAKKLGKEPLTAEEAKKYPHVINPEDNLKIAHHTALDMSDPYDKALYNLIMLSGRIAKSKAEWDPGNQNLVGYFYDEHASAVTENDKADRVFDAMKLIRDLSIDKYKNVILIYNYISKKGAYIPTKGISTDIQKNKLLKACQESPDEIMRCFPEHNKGVEQYGFILELINGKIIRETASREFYFESTYLGTSLDEILRNLGKKENEHLKTIFDHRLKVNSGEPTPGTAEMNEDQRKNAFLFKVTELKGMIVDDVEDDVYESSYNALVRDFSDYIDSKEFRQSVYKIKDYMQSILDNREQAKLQAEKDRYREELSKKELEDLHKSINHAKTPFKKEDCEAIWNDAGKLRDYMFKVKYPDA